MQQRLRDLGFLQQPPDGIYGTATEAAVRTFQASRGLEPDGVCGPQTWDALFGIQGGLAHRCLALTGSFETTLSGSACFGVATGDFDGQGISFGALQWNFGQGTLQPMLAELAFWDGSAFDAVFGAEAKTLRDVLRSPKKHQMQWARSIQDTKKRIVAPWAALFRALGATEECRNVQTRAARSLYTKALASAAEFSLSTSRGVALMFDIVVQNGSISPPTKARVLQDAARLRIGPGPEREVAVMRSIARHRAAASLSRFESDVLARKMTIAEGTGIVHGVAYDLDAQFGIRLQAADYLKAA